MSSSQRPTHYLVVTYPAWAHLKTEMGLCHTLLSLNPTLHLTVLIPANRSSPAALERSQYPPITNPERVTYIHYGQAEKTGENMYGQRGGYRNECLEWLDPMKRPLAKLEAVQDSISGKRVKLHQIPWGCIITDVTLGGLSEDMKGIIGKGGGKPPTTLAFAPYNTAFLAAMFSSKDADTMKRVGRVMAESGEDMVKRERLANEYLAESSDIVSIEGLWPYYLYEANPVQTETILQHIPRLAVLGAKFPTWTDGLIIGWPKVLGAKIQEDLEKTFGTVYQVGSQIPNLLGQEWIAEAQEVRDFLDKAILERGPKSVLYISFGSILFAPTKDQLIHLLDVLEELDRQYILVQGNLNPDVRPGVREVMEERVGKNGLGLLVDWAPQRAVLGHPATGLFLTHGGSNSTLEAIALDMPMVIWPAGYDQPYIANEIDKLGCGYELLQIRRGPNVGRPCARNGIVPIDTPQALKDEFRRVFADFEGELMSKLRIRVEELREIVAKDKESGSTRETLVALSEIDL